MRRFAFLLVLLATVASSQTRSDYERGAEAYQEGRFEQAVQLLGQAVSREPDSAEVHYLLARVLYDPRNPDRDQSRAGREVDRAVDLDPDNLVYLVAQLEQQRQANPWNTLIELYQLRRRAEAARRILAIDSTNAFGHEELGVQAIYDYYQYRNAIKLPGLALAPPDLPGVDPGNPGETSDVGSSSAATEGQTQSQTLQSPFGVPRDETFFEGAYGREFDDRFDVEALSRRGEAAINFGDRAQDAYARAIAHLRQALVSDPRRRDVYDHLVRLAVLSGEYQAVLPDMAEMFVQFPDDPEMWLYNGLVNQRLGQYQAAEVSFRQALERMDADTRAAYTDLTLILPPSEWDAFRADPGAFADRYWTSRDPRFLNDANERRSEHYARLVTADLLYRSDDMNLAGWKTERGRLFVRYGPPATDVVIEGGYGNVVERYLGRSEAFVAPDLVGAANRFNVWDYGDGVRFVFEDPTRNGRFSLYAPPADVYAIARNPDRMDFVMRAREEIRRRPERYDFKAPGRTVDLPYRVTAFKGDAGRTDLYVNYGIPVGESGPASDGVQADVDVTVRTGTFLVGPSHDLLVERRRTVYGLRGAQIVPFQDTRLWTSTEAMTATPADGYEVSLEFETASGQTSAVQRRAVDVPSFAGPGLQLSDVLLAYYVEEADRADPGRVFRDGVSVQPAPWGVFRIGDPIYLYVEAYGLGLAEGQSDYEVEAGIRPKDTSRGLKRLARRVFGGDGTAVSSAFEAQGSQPDDAIYLFLDATGQETGLYTLTVTVRDRVTGAEAHRETDLFLEE